MDRVGISGSPPRDVIDASRVRTPKLAESICHEWIVNKQIVIEGLLHDVVGV